MHDPASAVRRGAVVLCGGRSARMGRDKAWLPFGDETMLQRVVRIVADCVPDVVVVARRAQPTPPLPRSVRVVHDELEDRGPLGGLSPGLRASRADAVFVTGCDAPFVAAPVIDLLFERLGDADACVPQTETGLHPLCAVWRTSVVAEVERRLASDRLRATDLVCGLRAVRVGERDLRGADPDLLALANCNTPEAYEAALARARG